VDLKEFYPEFSEAFFKQLDDDFVRWGETWRKRNVGNQTKRVFARYRDYLDQYENAGKDVEWLKVIGNAYIAWVRINHPEVLIETI